MYKRRWNLRAWAAIPATVLIVAISVIAGTTASAAYTTQVALVPAAPQAISTLVAGTFDVVLEPIVTVPRLPSTSTSNDYEPLEPVNFVQGFALGVALVLIGWLLMLGRVSPHKD